MKETSPLWHQIAPSEYPWEREALAFVREALPDHEPYRAWANVEIVAEDGSIYEIDLLVLSPKGLFLVEIKSWDGTLEGDAMTWVLHRDGHTQTYDSPLLLANRKARKLASLLKRQKAARDVRFPFVGYVQSLLQLSSARIQRLRGVGAKTKKELREALRLLTPRFPAPAEDASASGLPALSDSEIGDLENRIVVSSLDLLLKRILPPARSKAEGERRILQALFGLSAEAPHPVSSWPSQTDVAEALGITRARVSQVLGKARQRWASSASLISLRDDIAKLLAAQGGAATVDELFAALLAVRGSA
jgi:hypothetical protein